MSLFDMMLTPKVTQALIEKLNVEPTTPISLPTTNRSRSTNPLTNINTEISNAAVFGDITLQTGGQSIGILGMGGEAGGGSYPISQTYAPSTEVMNNISNQITNTISNFYSETLTETITNIISSPESVVEPITTPTVNLSTTVIPSIKTDQTGQTPTVTTEQTAQAGGDWMQYIIAGIAIIGGLLVISQFLKNKKGGKNKWT
jgi:hypothetical protein